MGKGRIHYIDFIKTLTIFIIVTLHNGTWRTDFMATGSVASLVQFCVRLFCEGVPIFVLLNGFLLLDKPFDAKKHAKRTLRLLVMTVIWSVIMEIYFPLMAHTPISVHGVIQGVLETSISNNNTSVLWFLQKLFVVYLLFPIIKHLYDTHEKLYNYLLLAVIISTFTAPLLSLVADIFDVGLLHSVKFFVGQYTLVFDANVYLVYFMVGGYLRKNDARLPKNKLILAGMASALAACAIGICISLYQGKTYPANYNYSQIFLLFTLVALFLLCAKIPFHNKLVNKVMALVGDNTMGIYLLHKMIIVWLDRFHLASDSLLKRFGLSFIVFLISLGLTCLIRKIPKLSNLVKL